MAIQGSYGATSTLVDGRPEEILASPRQVAAGAKSCSSLLALATKHDVYAPIAEAVDHVVAGRMTAPQMMEVFIAKDTKDEAD